MGQTPDPRVPALAELSDRYEIEGEIGRGGMATVYGARDLRHGSRVAIKVLRQELVVALGGARFTREVLVTAALQHPHILPLLDSGETGGLPYYVMPFVSGLSLERRLAREGPLPIPEAVQYVAEMADGLAYAHGKGLIHRDIKPANVLLSEGHALIADFGIARVLDAGGAEALTESGLAVGTAAYMSPEQAAGERVDARADIYALGCVLYELLTGSAPFSGSSQRAIMARHAVDPVPSVRTVRPEVSRALEAVIARALAKMPADRFASASEFRTALLEAPAVTQSGDEAAPREKRYSSWRTVTTSAVVVTGVALALLARRGTAGPLHANRVMVYPLVLPGDWTGSRSAGEDVSTMIGSVLDGAGALRWIDGWQHLDSARRADVRSLPDDEANAIARKQKARYVLTGRIVMVGDSVGVDLSLRDLTGDTVVVRKRSSARTSEPWRAGLRAATELLPALIPGVGVAALQDWSGRNPQAVALFLSGEAASRRMQLEEALKQFKAAVEVDSTFGYAASRGAQAASWAHRVEDARTLAHVAVSHARSPRERGFAAGVSAYLDGRADSAAAALRATLAIDPEMSVAWIQLSETYLHLLPANGPPDSLAADALARAVALDPTNTQLLFHRVELAARSNDAARTKALAARFLAAATDTMPRGEVELVAGCIAGRWSEAYLLESARRRPQPLLAAIRMIGLYNAKCMHDGNVALLRVDTANTVDADGRRFFEIVGLQQALLARGDTAGAIAEVDRFIARWKFGASIFLSAAPMVPAYVARARQVAAADSARYGADFRLLTYSNRLWLLGIWAAIDGRIRTAEAVAADLAVRSARPGNQLDSSRFESVLAHVALVRGDTTEAIRRFSALLRRPAPSRSVLWDDAASLGLERLTLGRLLIARNQFADARSVLEVFDSGAPAYFPLYLSAAIQLRIKAASALGDVGHAAALRSRAARFAP